jgi:hypothetical protein
MGGVGMYVPRVLLQQLKLNGTAEPLQLLTGQSLETGNLTIRLIEPPIAFQVSEQPKRWQLPRDRQPVAATKLDFPSSVVAFNRRDATHVVCLNWWILVTAPESFCSEAPDGRPAIMKIAAWWLAVQLLARG